MNIDEIVEKAKNYSNHRIPDVLWVASHRETEDGPKISNIKGGNNNNTRNYWNTPFNTLTAVIRNINLIHLYQFIVCNVVTKKVRQTYIDVLVDYFLHRNKQLKQKQKRWNYARMFKKEFQCTWKNVSRKPNATYCVGFSRKAIY